MSVDTRQNKLSVDTLAILDALPDPTLIYNRQGYCLNVLGGKNTAQYGETEKFKQQFISSIFTEKRLAETLSMIEQVCDSGEAIYFDVTLSPSDFVVPPPDMEHSEVRHFEIYMKKIECPNSAEDCILCAAKNVTHYRNALNKLHEQQDILESISRQDHLTRIYNRVALEEWLPQDIEQAQEASQSLTTIMIDIDFFKQLNDKYGHYAGDKALIRFGYILRSHFVDIGRCYRYGGDEFLVTISGLGVEAIQKVLERFRRAVNDADIKNPDSLISDRLTVTIGVYHCDTLTKNTSVRELISMADQALLNGKSDRKNGMFFIGEVSQRCSEQ